MTSKATRSGRASRPDATAEADAPVVGTSMAVRPDPEVPERARRRVFTAKYKLEVLAAYDAAADGEKGPLMEEVLIPGDEIMVVFTGAKMRQMGYTDATFAG